MHIGAAIRHTRETLRLKLEMVALDAGFDPGNLSRIETGRQNPSVPRLEAIARAMEVTVADLYALVEPPRTLGACASGTPTNARGRSLEQSEWVQLRRSYEGLDATRRQLAMEFLQMLERMQHDEAPTDDNVAQLPVDEAAAARRESARRTLTDVSDSSVFSGPSLTGTHRVDTPALRILAAAGDSR